MSIQLSCQIGENLMKSRYIVQSQREKGFFVRSDSSALFIKYYMESVWLNISWFAYYDPVTSVLHGTVPKGIL